MWRPRECSVLEVLTGNRRTGRKAGNRGLLLRATSPSVGERRAVARYSLRSLTMHLNPRWEVEVSTASAWRAAGR